MTLAERAIEEPKRTAGDDSWNVRSNYYFCPTLCRNCKYFLKQESTYPYHCKAGSTTAASHKSKKEGYKQYDDCRQYKEKEQQQHNLEISSRNEEKTSEIKKTSYDDDDDDINTSEKRRIEREEKESKREIQKSERLEQFERDREEKKRQEKYDETHCFVCGKEDKEEHLIFKYNKYFHEDCFSNFKETSNGKKWVEEKEIYFANLKKMSEFEQEYKSGWQNVLGYDLNYITELERYLHIRLRSDSEIDGAIRDVDIANFILYMENKYQSAKNAQEEKGRAKKEAEEKARIIQEEQERAFAEKEILRNKKKKPIKIIFCILALAFFLFLIIYQKNTFFQTVVFIIGYIVTCILINVCVNLWHKATVNAKMVARFFLGYLFISVLLFVIAITGGITMGIAHPNTEKATVENSEQQDVQEIGN